MNSKTADKALNDAGTMDAALVHLSDLTEQALYDLEHARTRYGRVHGGQDAGISAHLEFMRQRLNEMAAYIEDVQKRTGQER